VLGMTERYGNRPSSTLSSMFQDFLVLRICCMSGEKNNISRSHIARDRTACLLIHKQPGPYQNRSSILTVPAGFMTYATIFWNSNASKRPSGQKTSVDEEKKPTLQYTHNPFQNKGLCIFIAIRKMAGSSGHLPFRFKLLESDLESLRRLFKQKGVYHEPAHPGRSSSDSRN
jgi:hypothetical protein